MITQTTPTPQDKVRVTRYQDYYRGIAPYYDLIATAKDNHPSIARELSELLPGPGYLCELGVGTGLLAREMISFGFSVLGIDVSPWMLSIARSKQRGFPTKIDLLLSDATNIPCGDDSFDCAVSHGGPIIAVFDGKHIHFETYLLTRSLDVLFAELSRCIKTPGIFAVNIQHEPRSRCVVPLDNGEYVLTKRGFGTDQGERTHTLYLNGSRALRETYIVERYGWAEVMALARSMGWFPTSSPNGQFVVFLRSAKVLSAPEDSAVDSGGQPIARLAARKRQRSPKRPFWLR